MRINLATPFAEKDAVKALGAKWDSTKKNWYVTDVEDLTPFLRWIPNSGATKASPVVGVTQKPKAPPKASIKPSSAAPTMTGKATEVPHCGCDVLPWDDCIHTENQ